MSGCGDEQDLFAQAMQDVAPMAPGTKGRQLEANTQTEVTDAQLQRREAALGLNNDLLDPNFLCLGEVPAKEPLEVLGWKKDGVQNAVFDKLRRGGYASQGSLDLHRKTVKQARKLVFDFLNKASAMDWRNLRIAPGKGEFSDTPGRLKSYLACWLEEHPEVIAFCSAQPRHGGVGAVYVLVRKSPAAREFNREQHGLKSDPLENRGKLGAE